MCSDATSRRLEDIVENIDRITRYTAGYDLRRFTGDQKCQDAVLHCLLRISEAARVLGPEAEGIAPAVPWRDIRGIGNRLRHEYQRVDVALIWGIVEKDLPPLRAAAEAAAAALARQP